MRTTLLTFALLLFLAVPRLSATETANEAVAPSVTAASVVDQAPTAELRLTEVQVRDSHVDDAAVAQFPRQGSFWWIVGAIVVGGVILAVLL